MSATTSRFRRVLKILGIAASLSLTVAIFVVANLPWEYGSTGNWQIPLANELEVPRLFRAGFPLNYHESLHLDASGHQETIFWSPVCLAVDCAIAVAVCIAVFVWLQRRRRRLKRIMQLTIADMLLVALVLTLSLGMWRIAVSHHDFGRRAIYKYATMFRTRTVAPLKLHAWRNAQSLETLERVTHLSVHTADGEKLSAIAKMPSLGSLQIRNSELDDDALVSLSSLRRLRELYITNSRVGDSVIRHLHQFQRLEVFSCNSPDITDQGVEHVLRLPKLRFLELRSAQISDRALARLARLESLQELILPSNGAIHGEGLVAFHGHPALRNIQFVPASRLGERECQLREIDLRDIPSLRAVAFPQRADLTRLHLQNLPSLKNLPASYQEMTAPIMPLGMRSNTSHFVRARNIRLQQLDSLVGLGLLGPAIESLQLETLPSLKHISAAPWRSDSSFDLPDQAARSIIGCRGLLSLDLSGAKFAADAFEGVADMRDLRVLKAARTSFDDVAAEHLGGRQGMTELHLSATAITDRGWRCLETLEALETVDVRQTSITRIKIHDRDRLRTLLFDGPLESLDLRNLPLYYGYLNLGNPLRELRLRQLPQLQGIRVTGLIDNVEIAETPALSSAQFIGIGAARRYLEQIRECDKLSALSLQSAELANDDLAILKEFPNLKSLVLEETNVSDTDLQYVSQLVGLESLNLTRTPVADDGLQHLRNLTELDALFLGGTKVTGSGLRQLTDFSSIRQLSLGETQLDDAAFVLLGRFGDLRWLRLSGTGASDTDIAHLADLTRLRELFLNDCPVSDDGILRLKTRSLRRLDVRDTKVTSDGVERLKWRWPRAEIEIAARQPKSQNEENN